MSVAEHSLTPSEYIQHHLTFSQSGTGFWAIHLDTFWVALVLGFLFVGLFAFVARRATAGVPGRLQAAIEIIVEMVAQQVKDGFHGKSKLVGPMALTVFVWIIFMNAMDFLPVDFLPGVAKFVGVHFLRMDEHHIYFRSVPTADINHTLAMSLTVILATIGLGIQAKGVGGFVVEYFTAPFHAHSIVGKILLSPINFFMQTVEIFSKILSMALRLFGNMFAGELVFMLIALMGSGAGLMFHEGGYVGSTLLMLGHIIAGSAWSIFHILIIVLQAYIFMMLTIVYSSIAVEAH